VEPVVHYIKSGRSFGPISVQDFLDLVEASVIGPSDLVRIEGATRWAPAREVVGQVRTGQISVRARAAAPRPSSGMPAGGHTVFTSAPPIPQVRLPSEALGAGAPSTVRPCPSCEGRSSAGTSFCKHCGADLRPKHCGGCGVANDSDARFCGGCGQRLGSLAPPPFRGP
jgi:hypothetical protein